MTLPAPSPIRVTTREKLVEAERAVVSLQRYTRALIRRGTITQRSADRRVAALCAIVADLRAQLAAEERGPDLLTPTNRSA